MNHLKLEQYCGGDSSLFLRADKFLGGNENIAKTLKEGDVAEKNVLRMPEIEKFYKFLVDNDKAPAPPLFIETDRIGAAEEKNYCFPPLEKLSLLPYASLPRLKRIQWC